ncbi:MAG: dTMP kinase [Acidobacteriota bacterium]
MQKGKFITLEGIEGSGKSVQLRLLVTELRNRDIPLLITREPGGTDFGRELRKVLLHRDGAQRKAISELLLYLADRYQHLEEVIRPALANGLWVLCDRYHDATLAYQGHARCVGFETVDELTKALNLLTPDLTLLLDVPVEVGLRRAQTRNTQQNEQLWSRFEAEDLEFHHRVREGYIRLAEREPERIRLIDGSGPPELVLEKLLEALEPLFPCN